MTEEEKKAELDARRKREEERQAQMKAKMVKQFAPTVKVKDPKLIEYIDENMVQREFDSSDMTPATVESLFQYMHVLENNAKLGKSLKRAFSPSPKRDGGKAATIKKDNQGNNQANGA